MTEAKKRIKSVSQSTFEKLSPDAKRHLGDMGGKMEVWRGYFENPGSYNADKLREEIFDLFEKDMANVDKGVRKLDTPVGVLIATKTTDEYLNTNSYLLRYALTLQPKIRRKAELGQLALTKITPQLKTALKRELKDAYDAFVTKKPRIVLHCIGYPVTDEVRYWLKGVYEMSQHAAQRVDAELQRGGTRRRPRYMKELQEQQRDVRLYQTFMEKLGI